MTESIKTTTATTATTTTHRSIPTGNYLIETPEDAPGVSFPRPAPATLPPRGTSQCDQTVH